MWDKWKLVLNHLEIVLFSALDRCKVCANVLKAQKLFWRHLIVLLGEVAQAEALFDLFRDSFNFGARKVNGLRRMSHGHGIRFGHTRWYSDIMHVK
jgi:hypothetical protein